MWSAHLTSTSSSIWHLGLRFSIQPVMNIYINRSIIHLSLVKIGPLHNGITGHLLQVWKHLPAPKSLTSSSLWLRFCIQPFKWIIKTRCIIHPCLLKIEQVIRYGHHGASVSNTLTLSNLWLLLSITFCQLHKYPQMQNPNMKVWCSYY